MKNVRMRFCLRTLLIFVFLSAVALVSTQWYLGNRNSKPIDDVIAAFNEEHNYYSYYHKKYVNDGQPPLTRKQVLDCLSDFLSGKFVVPPMPPSDVVIQKTGVLPTVDAVIQKIVTTERIPNDVQFVYSQYYFGQLGECGCVISIEIPDEEMNRRMVIIRIIKTASFTPDPQ